jgi:hypothetical protein
LHAADVVLSAIIVGKSDGAVYTPARYGNPSMTPADVQRFAAATGGQVITGTAPAQALAPVLKNLTTRYTFQYTAPSAEEGAFRRIRVEMTPDTAARFPGARLKARSGYTVGN